MVAPVLYASRSDVYNVGVPRAALVRPSRAVEVVDPASSSFTLGMHGLVDGAPVSLGVSAGGELPTGLSAGTLYYARLLTLADATTDENRFQLATTPTGTPVVLTDAGTATIDVVAPSGPTIDAHLEFYSRWIDQLIPADAVPLALPAPAWVRLVVALRAAIASAQTFGRVLTDQILQRERDAITDALRLAPGVPLRGDAGAQKPTNTAIARSAGLTSRTTRGSIP